MQKQPSVIPTWPADGLESVPACPLCGSAQRTLAYDKLRDYFFDAAPGDWRLYRCQGCPSLYLDPRPNQATIGIAYQQYFTHHSVAAGNTGLRWLWHCLRDDYFKRHIGLQSEHSVWPGRWLLPLFPLLTQGLDAALARNLEPAVPGRNRLLDVGCGNGDYMKFAARAGWAVEGLDIDSAAVAVARQSGLAVKEGGIELLAGEAACFDRITLSHVLEHVFDPAALLRDCFRLLKPGGTLWVETPNLAGVGLQVVGEYWRGLEPPRHLMFFSRAFLRELLVSVGFAGLEDRYSSLATMAIWRESRVIMDRAGIRRNWRQALPGRLLAEISAVMSPDSREFITFLCKKPS